MSHPNAADVYNGRSDEYVRFINDYCSEELGRVCQEYPSETSVFVVDLADVYQWDQNVVHDLKQYTKTFQRVFERAVADANTTAIELDDIEVRFRDSLEAQSVPELLKGDFEGELVTLRGQVERSSEVVPRLTEARFVCENCRNVYDIPVPEHGEIGMDRCPNGDCGAKSLSRRFEESEWHYHQLARIRQPAEESDGDAHIDVHLTKDAAGAVQSGERVDVTGVLKAHFEDIDDAIPEFYLSGHTVTHHQSDYETIDTDEHKGEIRAYAGGEHGNPYQLLIDSIAPVIIDPNESDDGMSKLQAVKLAVGLQLFGGWRREISAGNYVRGDSHIALIGDPSTGKSQILDSVADLSPRSSYASGKNATKAGITAAAVRDDFGDTEWSLDSGAIVNAHKGLCCIDEIDKVGGEVVSSLHSALEKQRLEVNKAGIDATLKCETALLAAGNPEGERFIDEEAVYQQLNIEPALYSRFDLVFTLRDDPDETQDARIARHKIRARTQAGLKAKGESADAPDIDPAIPKDVLRAYIAYARQEVHPVIKDEAVRDELESYHTEIRQRSSPNAPITHRKLDALMRLCEAAARVRLSEEITMEDVEVVKEVVGVSLGDVSIEDGKFGDYGGTSESQITDHRKKVLDAASSDVFKFPSSIAKEAGLSEEETRETLTKLRDKTNPPKVEENNGKWRRL